MIDTHCHLNDPQFAQDAAETLERARKTGVEAVLVAGYDSESNDRALALAGLPGVWVAVGVHPHDASSTHGRPDWLNQIFEGIAGCSRAAAVGEIGLDFHYTFSPKEVQDEVFRAQVRLASALGLPVTIHSRAAEDRVMDILEEESPPQAGAVLHAFTGTAGQAARALDLGCFIGCTGMVTFKKADDLRKMLSSVPLARLLLETDSPYLAPHPVRGKRNEPSFLPHIRDALAALYGCAAEEVERQTTENALSVFARMREDLADG